MALSSSFSLVYWLIGAIVLYFILRAIYRLTLHPLAKFPGPKLAALTSMYAASWDLPVASSFCKHLPELHDRYGANKTPAASRIS